MKKAITEEASANESDALLYQTIGGKYNFIKTLRQKKKKKKMILHSKQGCIYNEVESPYAHVTAFTA